MLSGRIETYKQYSQFKTLKEFNTTIEMFLLDHKKDFSKGEYVALNRLTKYCAKYYGVANAKIGTILKAIHSKSNGFGISRGTFERMLNKSKKLGILTILHTVKPKGGKGHNVYVFNKLSVSNSTQIEYRKKAETPTATKKNQPKSEGEAINLLQTNKTNTLSKRKETHLYKKLNYTFVSDKVPKEFSKLMGYFFNDSQLIEEYWKMVRIDTFRIRGVLLDDDVILSTAIHSFKQMIGKLKVGKVNNPIAYFKGVLHKQITAAYMA